MAPLEIRLHNLLVDPLAIDLLLTCIYESATDRSNLSLLPGCPVPLQNVGAIIDSFPALSTLQTAPDLRTAIAGNDGYGRDRERLLSWLCITFRGFLITAPQSFQIPMMPNSRQFLMLNSHPEKEVLYHAQNYLPTSSTPVFHGTKASRLFLILTEGLKSMSNTSFMLHGASGGAGVYCGADQSMSLHYSGSTGRSWRNSSLGRMRIMLGCELSNTSQVATGREHVVNENSLLIRYVFLLPPLVYNPPARHLIELPMSSAFARIRSGVAN
jgi:hypothetical protein